MKLHLQIHNASEMKVLQKIYAFGFRFQQSCTAITMTAELFKLLRKLRNVSKIAKL